MRLQILDYPRVLSGITEDGKTVVRKRYDGHPYQVPEWCGNSLEDHVCAWGCMGIMHGLVAKHGRDYCKLCEMYIPKDGEVHVVKTAVLHNEEEFDSYVMGLYSRSGIGYPMQYPAIAVFTHSQTTDPQWGNKHFATQTQIIYPDEFEGHTAKPADNRW